MSFCAKGPGDSLREGIARGATGQGAEGTRYARAMAPGLELGKETGAGGISVDQGVVLRGGVVAGAP